MASNEKFELLQSKASHEQGALFGQIIDRLLAGEVLDVRRLREEYPDIGGDVLEQLQAYQDMLPRDDDAPSMSTLGDYSIVRQIGRGGMGIVYEAWQNSINRRVALKVLPAGVAADSRTLARFVREAHIAGTLKHPHIVSVYGMGIEAQTPYFAMEFVEGETLAEFLSSLRTSEATAQVADAAGSSSNAKSHETSAVGSREQASAALPDSAYCWRMARDFIGVAEGLYHAHQQGVIHRDIKPSNLMFESSEPNRLATGFAPADSSHGSSANDSPRDTEPTEKLRILDFGLARYEGGESLTMTGDVVGTVAYMSPEQARAESGTDLDHRTDIYSLGATLYEALTLRSPLKGRNTQETLSQIASKEPIVPRAINPHIPRDLETVVLHCLRKDPRDRYCDAKAVAADLERCLRGDSIVARPQSTIEKIARRGWRRRRLVVVFAAISAVVLALTLFSLSQQRGKRDLEWVQQSIPEIQRSIEHEHYITAFELVKRARQLAPEDETIKGLGSSFISTISVTTDPPGAKVSIREYGNPDGKWLDLGTTPLDQIEAPSGECRWRVDEASCVQQHFTRIIRERRTQFFDFVLTPKTTTRGMLLLGAKKHTVGVGKQLAVQLPRFWMDQREVSNEEYQEFVDQGGYQRREYWQEPFTQDSSTVAIPFDEAIARFLDRTGTPGPHGWSNGRYPDGKATYPVTGVSWFEASAYGRFRGKSLPTVYHWRGESGFQNMIVTSMHNIGTEDMAPVGEYAAISPNGLQDMIGNVKEWCSNSEINTNKRYALGGSWDDPSYAFSPLPSFSPWERSESIGFRCVQFGEEEARPELFAALDTRFPIDYSKRHPAPASDVLVYKEQLYAYEPIELEPEVVRIREDETVVVEKVTLNTAYGDRFSCLMYLPKGFQRPLQAMIYGASNGEWFKKNLMENHVHFPYLVSSGRAFLVPAMYGHFGRSPGRSAVDGRLESQQHTQRRRICQVQDVMRVIDYLETRDDIGQEKIGYISISSGSQKAPIMLAVEKRFRTGVMIAGGLAPYEVLASCDPFNFAPNVSVPVLMLNGETDAFYPLEEAQIPLFRLLGSLNEHKRHSIYPGGHGFYVSGRRQKRQVEREILDWLDKYLGVPETSDSREP